MSALSATHAPPILTVEDWLYQLRRSWLENPGHVLYVGKHNQSIAGVFIEPIVGFSANSFTGVSVFGRYNPLPDYRPRTIIFNVPMDAIMNVDTLILKIRELRSFFGSTRHEFIVIVPRHVFDEGGSILASALFSSVCFNSMQTRSIYVFKDVIAGYGSKESEW